MLITIVLTVYNGERDLKKCLESILSQTYNNIEIIVVDDCSTDTTGTILTEYKSEIKIIKNKVNYGRSRSKNIGLNNSSGEIIVFIEDDAVYHKKYIEKGISHFSQKDTIGVIGPYTVLNKDTNIVTKAISYDRMLNFKNYKPFSMWFYRRSDLIAIGGFDENLEFGEDVVPYKKIKNNNNKVIFEKEAKWKHKEPDKLSKMLLRKYKGGLGMAGLYKNNYESLKISFIIIGFTIIGLCIILTYNILILLVLFLLILISFYIFNIKNISYIKGISGDNYITIIIGFYIKFLWRIFTVIGYNYGLTISISKINKTLKGR